MLTFVRLAHPILWLNEAPSQRRDPPIVRVATAAGCSLAVAREVTSNQHYWALVALQVNLRVIGLGVRFIELLCGRPACREVSEAADSRSDGRREMWMYRMIGEKERDKQE